MKWRIPIYRSGVVLKHLESSDISVIERIKFRKLKIIRLMASLPVKESERTEVTMIFVNKNPPQVRNP